jgi:hypothetical protein
MISPTLEMREINPVHWRRLTELLLPPPGGDPTPRSGGGALSFISRATAPAKVSSTALSPAMPAVALVRGGQVLRIFQLGGGTLSHTELPTVSQEELRAFRKRHHLPFVAAVDLDALPDLWSEVQARVSFDDDLVAQQLMMLQTFRRALGRSIWVDPMLFGAAPLPTYKVLQLTFDRMLPDRKSFVFYLTEAGQIWTSLIAVKRHGDLCLVTTHDAIAHRVRLSSIRSDAPAVLKAVSQEIAPPHIGVFLPLSVWHETAAGDRSAIARALAARRAAISPAPPWLLALVGVGAVAEAASRSGRLANTLLKTSRLGAQFLPGQASRAAEKLVDTLSNPLEALGLDPWEMLRWGREWRRRVQLDRTIFTEHTEGRTR